MSDFKNIFSFKTEPLPNVFRDCKLLKPLLDFPVEHQFSAIAFEPEANKLHLFQKTIYLQQVGCIILED